MAVTLLQTVPGWHEFCLDRTIAELAHAARLPRRVMKRPGAPKGSRWPGFEWLIMRIWSAGEMSGIEWTAYKDRSTTRAVGSLVDFIRSVKDRVEFPSGFMPASEITLLNTIYRVKTQLAN